MGEGGGVLAVYNPMCGGVGGGRSGCSSSTVWGSLALYRGVDGAVGDVGVRSSRSITMKILGKNGALGGGGGGEQGEEFAPRGVEGDT